MMGQVHPHDAQGGAAGGEAFFITHSFALTLPLKCKLMEAAHITLQNLGMGGCSVTRSQCPRGITLDAIYSTTIS